MMPTSRGLWLLAILVALNSACSRETPAQAPPADGKPTGHRVVTLSPHLAELVHAAGAGDRLVGVSAYSNYPGAVLALPLVGDAFSIDQEQLAVLAPDLVLAWESGTPTRTVDELRALGYRVEVLRTRRLVDVAAALRTIGALTRTEETANVAAERFLSDLAGLREAAAGAEPIRVFYQVSAQPLYTVNGAHYVSELIELCGGQNIFAQLGELAPAVSAEAVLVRDPELLLAGQAGSADRPFAAWLRWPEMAANRYANRFFVQADLLGRAGPRLVSAGTAICRALHEGRANRARAESRQ